MKRHNIILILGGARSGKSRLAVKIAEEKARKAAFIATCRPLDEEMEARIRVHRKARPRHWKTFEEYKNIPLLLKKIGDKFDIIILDCLTLLASNLLLDGRKEVDIERETKRIVSIIGKIRSEVIIVSNEVGLGIVPDNRLGRDFRDISGRMNQIIAKEACEVFFMVSGLPMRVKGEGSEKHK